MAGAADVSKRGREAHAAQFAAQIERARQGSDSALGEVLEACRKYLLLVANQAVDSDLRPKGGGSDFVQETFVAAKQDFERFRGSTEQELLAWLSQILAYRVSKHVRSFRQTDKRNVGREECLDADPAGLYLAGDAETPSAAVIASEERHRVQVALERLGDDDRQALLLRSWQQRPFEEVGRMMNRSPDAARKLWARAVERLGREVSKMT